MAKKKALAAIEDEVLVQLATRIPRTLHRQLKLRAVEEGTTVMDIVMTALSNILGSPAPARSAKKKKPALSRFTEIKEAAEA